MQIIKCKKGHYWLRKWRQGKDAKFASISEDQCGDMGRFHARQVLVMCKRAGIYQELGSLSKADDQ